VSACQDLAKIDGVKAPIGFAKETYFIFIHFFNWATALDSNYHQDLADVASGSKTMADIATVKQWALDLDKSSHTPTKVWLPMMIRSLVSAPANMP